ncbi:hypothetical protein CCR75_001559 [Bremia lactucae]|uniref:RxLR effector protein n=1 Tax=Bremia lactucae TaxID=4779 RepID=A0A976IFQ5_BRELC|nr:hypothetical protein CCR75_001559 [Bremia lactucae]
MTLLHCWLLLVGHLASTAYADFITKDFKSLPPPAYDTNATQALVSYNAASEERNGPSYSSALLQYIDHKPDLLKKPLANLSIRFAPPTIEVLPTPTDMLRINKIKNNIINSHQWKLWARKKIEFNPGTDPLVVITKAMVDELGIDTFFLMLIKAAHNKRTKAVAEELEKIQFQIWTPDAAGAYLPMEFYKLLQLDPNDSTVFMERLPILLRYWRHYMDVCHPGIVETLPVDKMDEETVKRFGPYWKYAIDIEALLGLNSNGDDLLQHPAINIWLDFMRMYTARLKEADPLMITTFQVLGKGVDSKKQVRVDAIFHFVKRWTRKDLQPDEVLNILGLSLNTGSLVANPAFIFLKTYMKKMLATLDLNSNPTSMKTIREIFRHLADDKSGEAEKQRATFVSFFMTTQTFTPMMVKTILGIETTAGDIETNSVWIIWIEYLIARFLKKKDCPSGPIADTLRVLSSPDNNNFRTEYAKRLASGLTRVQSGDAKVKVFLEKYSSQRPPQNKKVSLDQTRNRWGLRN